MVYTATLSESRRVMCCQLVIEDFGPNIQHIAGVENIVADMLSILLSISINKYEPRTRKAQCHANDLFVISRSENNQYCFPLNILNVQIEKK